MKCFIPHWEIYHQVNFLLATMYPWNTQNVPITRPPFGDVPYTILLIYPKQQQDMSGSKVMDNSPYCGLLVLQRLFCHLCLASVHAHVLLKSALVSSLSCTPACSYKTVNICWRWTRRMTLFKMVISVRVTKTKYPYIVFFKVQEMHGLIMPYKVCTSYG